MIQCKDICLAFNEKSIFTNFNAKIKAGENVCIGGASGKGKSSLLNLFQGYVIPQSGSISVAGKNLSPTTIKEIREQIMYVPQNIHLPVKNGSALADLMGIQKKLPKIKQALTQLGLTEDFLEKDFMKISGGQKQRIVIAVCLGLDKNILLMDEPTASLDDDSINLLIKTIGNLKDKTIVSASHNQQWAESCDRIIEL
ncbi:ABC transporter ATP-binding protein [Draconibacterium sp. IB214405]|uniref:ABC transporter ATP-binding protein n=1 Tax=Draconibacterium sp. IB214405 TaxID=3097352 RepID=UPI002A13EEDA|nr:ABC transporter ATP-binding protein [Draconibacterium sp. IB214405]MDX8339451.1 ABC transporter ATP-binding protein [Draconibacterium sp. IB214405]